MEFKMLHTCIRVMDLEKSLDFYEKALGLRISRKKDFPEDGFTLVYLTDSTGSYELELTYNYGREEAYEIGNGFSHIALSSEDLEESWKKHKDMGYKTTDLMGLPGEKPRYYFITDPDGYDIEIIRA